MPKINPFRGEVLLEMLPDPEVSDGGIFKPDVALHPDERSRRAMNPEKPSGETGIVRAIGGWPVTSKGLAMIPDIRIGDRVVIPRNLGKHLERGKTSLRLLPTTEVLAVMR